MKTSPKPARVRVAHYLVGDSPKFSSSSRKPWSPSRSRSAPLRADSPKSSSSSRRPISPDSRPAARTKQLARIISFKSISPAPRRKLLAAA